MMVTSCTYIVIQVETDCGFWFSLPESKTLITRIVNACYTCVPRLQHDWNNVFIFNFL